MGLSVDGRLARLSLTESPLLLKWVVEQCVGMLYCECVCVCCAWLNQDSGHARSVPPSMLHPSSRNNVIRRPVRPSYATRGFVAK